MPQADKTMFSKPFWVTFITAQLWNNFAYDSLSQCEELAEKIVDDEFIKKINTLKND